MKDYILVSDNTTDLPTEFFKENDIELIELPFLFEGKEYVGNDGVDNKYFFDRIREGEMPTTSQVNVETFVSVFSRLAREGKDIFYVAFSSGLSGTYNSACMAKKELEDKIDVNIEIIDTLAASMGEALLLCHVVENKKNGMSLSENKEWLLANRLKVCHYVTVNDLKHLHRGGRVSKASAVLGTMLGIKPIIVVDDEGHLVPINKIRGRHQAIEELYKMMAEEAVAPEEQIVFISHADCKEEAELLGNMIKEKLKVKEIRYGKIGPIIGAHAGPGTIALFFFGNKRMFAS